MNDFDWSPGQLVILKVVGTKSLGKPSRGGTLGDQVAQVMAFWESPLLN